MTIETSIELEESTGAICQIEAVVTASNLKGDVRARALVPVEQRSVTFSDAYDVEGGGLKLRPAFTARKTDEDAVITLLDLDGRIAG